ncbi:TPA: ABC transporter permease, partial [Clostridioides difficile]|nr:ABC transporter permease [Clostridioides difficile]
MREYIAFTKKEFKENLRNYKLFSLIILFLVFGIMSPLSA